MDDSHSAAASSSIQTPEKPGTIIVDTTNNYLYYILLPTARQCNTASQAAQNIWDGPAAPEVGAS